MCRLIARCTAIYIVGEARNCESSLICRAKNPSEEPAEKKFKRDSLFIDRRGKLTHFNHKKVSRKRGSIVFKA